jgi:hypothetical protein
LPTPRGVIDNAPLCRIVSVYQHAKVRACVSGKTNQVHEQHRFFVARWSHAIAGMKRHTHDVACPRSWRACWQSTRWDDASVNDAKMHIATDDLRIRRNNFESAQNTAIDVCDGLLLSDQDDPRCIVYERKRVLDCETHNRTGRTIGLAKRRDRCDKLTRWCAADRT